MTILRLQLRDPVTVDGQARTSIASPKDDEWCTIERTPEGFALTSTKNPDVVVGTPMSNVISWSYRKGAKR